MSTRTLDSLGIDLDNATDLAALRHAVRLLYNLVEELATDNDRLREENQRLRDEIAHLKGEQGKPNVNGRNRTDSDHSSEVDRKHQQPKPPKPKGSKRNHLRITRTETLTVDPANLPPDARRSGYETTIIQELVITTEVIEYQRETWYSPSLGKMFTAPLPPGIHGTFGPHLKSLVVLLKTLGNMSEPAITNVLHSFGVDIGKSSIDRILLQDTQPLQDEKQAIVTAGLQSTDYQHLDDTSARVKGENWYTHVLCNPWYTAFFTREHKDRLTVLSVVSGVDDQEKLPYVWNGEARSTLFGLGWANKHDALLDELPKGVSMTYDVLANFCQSHQLPDKATAKLREAMAIAAYHTNTDIPIIPILMADDAPQFKLLTQELALCWIHDGRHYKKLRPVIPNHRIILNGFLTDYWQFYHELLAYKDAPSRQEAERLRARFVDLFTTETGYQQLDDRIAKTKAKEQALLLVLTHPELPLHNNPAELGARAAVRKRDVSLHTMTDEGTKAQDALLTIRETARKLGINLYDYLFDRISRSYAMCSLAETIRERSRRVATAAVAV